MNSLNCRHCGQKLGLLERWRNGHFCSADCRKAYDAEADKLAVACLVDSTQKKKKPDPPKAVPLAAVKKKEVQEEQEPEIPEFTGTNFEPQVPPGLGDRAIKATGFPSYTPSQHAKRKENVRIGGDRIPDRVMLLHEERRLARAIWITEQLAEPASPDGYRGHGRYAIYPPEIKRHEVLREIPYARVKPLTDSPQMQECQCRNVPAENEGFNWQQTCSKPRRFFALSTAGIKAGLVGLDLDWREDSAADFILPELSMEANRDMVMYPIFDEPLAPLKFFPRQMVRRPIQQVPYAGPPAPGVAFPQAIVAQEILSQAMIPQAMIPQEIVAQEVVPYLTEQPPSPVSNEPAWPFMQAAPAPSFAPSMPAIGSGHMLQSVPAPQQMMPATHAIPAPQVVPSLSAYPPLPTAPATPFYGMGAPPQYAGPQVWIDPRQRPGLDPRSIASYLPAMLQAGMIRIDPAFASVVLEEPAELPFSPKGGSLHCLPSNVSRQLPSLNCDDSATLAFPELEPLSCTSIDASLITRAMELADMPPQSTTAIPKNVAQFSAHRWSPTSLSPITASHVAGPSGIASSLMEEYPAQPSASHPLMPAKNKRPGLPARQCMSRVKLRVLPMQVFDMPSPASAAVAIRKAS